MDHNVPQDLHLKKENIKEGLTPAQWAHIAKCSRCADLFADYMEARPLLSAPKDFQESVMQKSRQADVVIISKTNQLSRRLQLFSYSLKVGFAVACALFLLFVMPVTTESFYGAGLQTGHVRTSPELKEPLHRRVQDFTSDLNDIFKWR